MSSERELKAREATDRDTFVTTDRPTCIVVIYGPELGRRAALGRAAFEIGRSTKSELCIDQESVSRHHARITFGEGGHYIEDLGSTNGTHVNDVRIKEPTLLDDGVQIKIGRSLLKFMSGDNLETNYHEEIYRLMTVDALTQTFNKRYFNDALEREFNRSVRYQRELSLVVFDIDHFRSLNDGSGHLAGDAVLRQVAVNIKSKLRQQDIFARIGGEEFAVLLPEVTVEGARVIAEKIRKIVEATATAHEDKTLTCTVSLGIASFTEGLENSATLTKAADAKLGDAKAAGRNRSAG